MEGYLQKWTNYIYGYKKRYFVLKGNILYYYKKKADKVKGKVHLAITVIDTKSNNQIKLDSGLKVLNLKCESQEERDRWFNAMQVAKFEGNKEKDINGQDKVTDFNQPINNVEDLSSSNNFEVGLNELKNKFEILIKNNEQLEVLLKSPAAIN